MTAAVTLLATARWTDDRSPGHGVPGHRRAMDTPSYEAYTDGPWLTAAAMRWFWDAYCPDHQQRFEITASPLRASLDELRGCPPLS